MVPEAYRSRASAARSAAASRARFHPGRLARRLTCRCRGSASRLVAARAQGPLRWAMSIIWSFSPHSRISQARLTSRANPG